VYTLHDVIFFSAAIALKVERAFKMLRFFF